MKTASRYLAIVTVMFSTAASAVDIHLRHGFDFGGEQLAELTYVDGTTEDITAGGGEHTELGLEFQTPLLNNEYMTTELSFGYKYDGIYAQNLEAEFSRLSVTLLQYYNKTNPRIGAGITRHFKGRYEESGSIGSWQSNVNISHGLVFVIDYQLKNAWNFGAKVIRMDYTDLGVEFEANSFGIFAGYTLSN